MPSIHILNEVEIERTPRLMQVEGMFDLIATEVSEFSLKANLPVDDNDWSIGLITGPSGSGKSSIGRELWPECLVTGHDAFDWHDTQSIVDSFPQRMPIKEITSLLSSVGFSSPPSWLRPFRCLSNGEQFRVSLARAISEKIYGRMSGTDYAECPLVVDEFTSVVDRTVARIGSSAIAKTIRRYREKPDSSTLQFVAISCHRDIEEWLQPDWIFDTLSGEFSRRLLQRRPDIEIRVRKAKRSEWELFRRHHYLSDSLSAMCSCYVGEVEGREAVFSSVLSFSHAVRPGWREHRTVCLPDFQGVGIGSAMSDFIAGMYCATGKPYRSTTSHPAMISHRLRSSNWKMTSKPNINSPVKGNLRVLGEENSSRKERLEKFNQSVATNRLTVSFEYVGDVYLQQAKRFDIVKEITNELIEKRTIQMINNQQTFKRNKRRK